MKGKIGVIGFGNIAKAIITPLLDKGLINPKDVFCLVKTSNSLENIKKNYKYNVNIIQSDTKESNSVWNCQIILLAIKPQQLQDIIESQDNKQNEQLMISILAGVSIEKLSKKFPNHRCARVVTNIPIIVGRGLTGICWGEKISEEDTGF